MSTSVGTLTIEMAANILRLQQDMDKAKTTVENTMAKISKAAGAAGMALGALGVTVGVGAFAGWIKGAIDAADETSKLAQKIGLAVPQVAGLQLAFRQSGIDAGALQTSMSKLSVAIADGNDAFVAMNISTKKADGTLKTTREMLGDIADKFKDYEDGAAKTALAVQIFGRAGADLIPLLNGGSEALDEFDAMAKKLGLTLDEDTAKRAEKFNDTLDLMGQGFKGISAQVAAQMLPTLEGLADQFFSSMTEGDRLKKIGDALAIGLKSLYVVGVALVGAFRAVGDTLYAVGAQAMAVMRGDFSGAVKIGEQYAADMKANWTGSLAEIDKAWNANGSTAVSTMAATSAAFKTQAPVVSTATKKMTDETAKNTAETAKQEAEYQKLIHSIENKTEVMIAEADGTGKLTEAQKIELKVQQDLRNGTLKLTEEQKANLDAVLKLMLATEDKIKTDKEMEATQLKIIKVSEQFVDAQKKETSSLIEGNLKLQEQNDVLRLGESAVRAREIAVLRAQATDLDFYAATFEGNEELANQARLLRERANLLEDNAGLVAAKATADEWKKTSESIESSLTDALMRGFESGEGFGKNLMSTLTNMFKTLILRPIIQPIAQAGSSMVLNALGITSSAASAAGGASTLGSLASGGGLLGSMANAGQYFGTGFMNTISGSGAMTGLTAGAEIGGMSGFAMQAGAVMPYVAAALALVSLVDSLDDSGTLHSGGTAMASATGARATTGEELNFVVQTNEKMQTSIVGMAGSISNTLNGLSRAFGMAEEVVVGLGFADDTSADGAWGALKILASGRTLVDWASGVDRWPGFEFSDGEAGLAEFTAKIATDVKGMISSLGLPEWAMSITNNLQDGASLEQVLETLNQVAAIQSMLVQAGEALTLMGGPFAALAASGDAAVMAISGLVGGIDQLVSKAQGFMANYYTEQEQSGVIASSLVQALSQAGFTQAQIEALETRADFRTLLESLNVTTTTGQEQFATLLNLQDQFAGLTSTMSEQQMTLLELMESAPQVTILEAMVEAETENQSRIQTAEELAQTTLNSMDGSLTSLNAEVANLSGVMVTGLSAISSATSGAIASANEIAEAAIAAAQKSAADAIAQTSSEYALGGTGFASGGFYNGGMAMVGEHGPELINFGAPGQIYTAPATASMMGGGDVTAEIRALREEVSMMRMETRATAVNTSKIAKLQDNWDVRGLTVKTDADQPLDTVTV
jgi:hypothetical protein